MVQSVASGTEEGRKALVDFIKRPNSVGCVTSSFITGGGDLISEVPEERYLAFLVSELSDVRHCMQIIQ
jgi:hypothetical protein